MLAHANKLGRFALRIAFLLLALGVQAWAATYYVCAATGSPCNASDSNAGTSQTATWLHAPGMPNFTGSYTAAAGDKIILRGGDTWHVGNSSATPYTGGTWVFPSAGASGNLIYIGGGQKNWYAGASWVRPVITGDNPVFSGTSYPASCAYDFGTPTIRSLVTISQYNQLDNIEITGDCWSGALGPGNPGMVNVPGNDLITNNYCHGWTFTSTSVDVMGCFASSDAFTNTFLSNVFDGDDAVHFAAGNVNCTTNANTPCGSGVGIYDAAATVRFNMFHNIRVGGVLVDSSVVCDNTFEYMATSPNLTISNRQHDDAIMYYHGVTSATGVGETLCNNMVRHNRIAQEFYIPVSGGSTANIFGNVFEDNQESAQSNCIQLNAQSSGTQTLNFYGNTIDQDTDVPNGTSNPFLLINGCQVGMWGTSGGNSFGIPWTGPIFAANNHLIGLSSLADLFVSRSAGTSFPITDNGGEVIMSTATARAENYCATLNSPCTVVNDDAPSTLSSGTVGQGTNQSAQILTFSPDTFGSFAYATSGGAALVSEFGGYAAVYPAIYQNPRPATWDAGAYQFTPVALFNFNADNLYCPTVGCTPTWGATDGPATLPIAAINTAAANTPSPGSVISVGPTTAALTSALAAATCGETLQLTAGASYGNITWPTLNCSQSNWLRLTVAGASTNLPPQGTRITPAYSGVASLQGRPPYAQPSVPGTYTAQIGTSSTTSPITFHSGTSYAIIGPGVEITNNSGGYVNALINIGQIGGISNIILDRVWCHGNENISETQRCLDVSSTTNVAVIDSTLTDFVCYTLGTCSDAQGILGGENCVNSNPEGPYKFVNDFIESTGENILFGGGCGLTVPADMEIRLNTFFKPRWWNAFDPSYVPAANGHSYEIKNLFELKNGNRVLFEGNTLQNSWASAQNGSAFLLTPVNQGGNCPTCEDANIASRYNTISTSCTPFELALVNNGSGDAAAGNSYSIHDNVADNQGYATGGCTTGQPGLELTEDTAITSPAQTINNVTLNHNTIVYAASRAALQAIISLTGPTIASGGVMYNIADHERLDVVRLAGNLKRARRLPPGELRQRGLHSAVYRNPGQCWSPNTVAGNCFMKNGALTHGRAPTQPQWHRSRQCLRLTTVGTMVTTCSPEAKPARARRPMAWTRAQTSPN